MKQWFIAGLATMGLSFYATASHSASLDVGVGDTLLGIDDLQIGSAAFDVDFLDGSCVSTAMGCDDSSDFVAQSQVQAEAAVTAIQDFLANTIYPDNPSLVTGCSDLTSCVFVVYFAPPANGEVGIVAANIGFPGLGQLVDLIGIGDDSAGFDFLTVARLSPVDVSTIPVPAAAPLFASVVAGAALLGQRRRRKRNA